MSNKSLSILVLTRTTKHHATGGFEDHIQTLYTGLVAKGHRVYIITTAHPDKAIGQTEVIDGINYIFIPNIKPGSYSNEWWKKSVIFAQKLIKKRSIDIIHSQSMAGRRLFEALVKDGDTTPRVISYHGTNYDEYVSHDNVFKYTMPYKIPERIDNWIRWQIKKRTIDKSCHKTADVIIATSNEQRRIFEKVYAVKTEKLETIFNGMDISFFKPNAKPEDLLEKYLLQDKKIVLGLARFSRDKGLPILVKAFAKLAPENPNYHLLLVGDGMMRPKLEQLVDIYNIRPQVTFTGFISFDRLADYFNLADVFVNSTIRQNGYDLTMIEAMACETPVIATAIGSHPTLIEDGVSGHLFPITNSDVLAQKIQETLSNNQSLKQMGEAARIKIVSAFTDTQMLEKTEALFFRLDATGKDQ